MSLRALLGSCAPYSSSALSVLPSFALPVCLPSSVVVPVSVLPASPAPRLVFYMCSGPACTLVHWCLPLGIWLQL